MITNITMEHHRRHPPPCHRYHYQPALVEVNVDGCCIEQRRSNNLQENQYPVVLTRIQIAPPFTCRHAIGSRVLHSLVGTSSRSRSLLGLVALLDHMRTQTHPGAP